MSNQAKKTVNIKFIVQAALIAAIYATLTIAQNIILPGTASMAVQFRVSEVLTVLAFFTPAAIPGLTIGCVVANISSVTAGLGFYDMIFGSIATLLAAITMYALGKAKLTDIQRTVALFVFGVIAAIMLIVNLDFGTEDMLRFKINVILVIAVASVIWLFALLWLVISYIYRKNSDRVKMPPIIGFLMPAVFNGIIVGFEIDFFFIGSMKFNFTDFLIQGGCVALGELGVCIALGMPFAYIVQKLDLFKESKQG